MRLNKQFYRFLIFFTVFAIATRAIATDLEILVTNQDNNALENVVVYAEGNTKDININQAPVVIEQKQKMFFPLISVAQAGSAISFPNNDTVRHHVYSFSPAKTFELKLYSGVPSKPVVFDKAGTVVLGCNIHDQMLAYVHVVETPYFAKTNAAGKAKLSLPNGDYIVKAWYYASKKENLITEQSVKLNTPSQITLKIDAKSTEK